MSSHDRPVPPPKKAYRRPVIHVYGNIRAITQAVGANNNPDGGVVMGMMMSAP
jgi:hypothetical protein